MKKYKLTFDHIITYEKIVKAKDLESIKKEVKYHATDLSYADILTAKKICQNIKEVA